MIGVPWRRVVVAVAAVAVVLGGVLVALRADGYPAIDATVPRATRWFVDSATGFVVLADGFSGETLARLDIPGDSTGRSVVQSPSGVAVLDRSSATARRVDTAELRMGPPQSMSLVAAPDAVVGVGQAGLVAVDPRTAQALLLPAEGEQVPFDLGVAGQGDDTRVAPDGSVLTLAGGGLTRHTTNGSEVLAGGLSDAQFTLVGGTPLLLDADRGQARFGDGEWQSLPDGVPPSEIVLQEPGPSAECGWLGADDHLWCVGEDGFDEDVEVAGLDIDGADLLSIAGDAAALVRRATSDIVRIDWRSGLLLDGPDDDVASVPAGASLRMSTSIDLVWVDEIDGNTVWAVHPWGINVIRKDDTSSPLIDESGEVLEEGDSEGVAPPVAGGNDEALQAEEHEPDNNGIDDPPVAVDDPVTARSGTTVPIVVTANDYDPDGEAIALSSVAGAQHGTVDLASATTVSYQPEPGFVGLDQFDYTIVDGNGTEDTATVTIELLPIDTVNQAPVGSPDATETGPTAPVTIDVLLNDIDPERDPLRIDTFTPPDVGGEVSETLAPSGLPGLKFVPDARFSGTVTFTYRPVDTFGAVGEAVEVTVEVAQPSDDNRPPIVRPDSMRLRRNVAQPLAVLANDRDPDGDRMTIDVVRPLRPGLEVNVEGDHLEVVVRAGAARLLPFEYTVDDGVNEPVRGAVLVVVISDGEPNRPPIANGDNATAVAGTQTLIDVLANDTDPDGDPVILASVTQPVPGAGAGTVRIQGRQVQYTAGRLDPDDPPLIDRFAYEISDGNGNSAKGEVTVRVLPERVAAPPDARDDAATTNVDVAVTIDVLRNDLDPSGERPTLVGTPGCPGGGTATVTNDDRVTYTPPAGQTGVFTCTYEVTNSQRLLAQATIVISVLPPSTTNQPPLVPDRNADVAVNDRFRFDLLEGVTDPDGPTSGLRVVSSTTPSAGVAERDGRYLYYTAGPILTTTAISYQVADDDGGVTTGRIAIRIVEHEEPPQAVADGRSIEAPGTPQIFEVLENDTDDGPPSELTLDGVRVTSGSGTAAISGRSVTLTPQPDFVGDLIAEYTVRDADGLTDTGTITLEIRPPRNRAPIAGDDQAQVASGGRISVPIALNDLDPDGDLLLYTISSGPDPAIGSARLQNGLLEFTSTPGASGTAVIVYTIDDGALSASATVSISVLPCASAPPEARDVALVTGYQQPIFIDLHAYASNGEIVQVGPPLGAASGIYTPPPGENGNVSFTYVVRNGCNVEDVGTVTIDVNQDPIGSPYVATMGRTQQLVIPVSSLASDAEPLVISALEGGPEWVTVVDEGRAILVDPSGRAGRADVVAVISDPGGLVVRVPVTIELINQPPVAAPDSVRADTGPVTFDPLANDSDPDGDSIALQSVPATLTFPNGVVGTIQRLGDDQLRIDPNGGLGSATFMYNIVDQHGLVSADTTVTVIVNSPPSAAQLDVVMAADSSVTVAVNASDPDGDPLVLQILDDPSPLVITVNGLTLTIRAPAEAAHTNYDLRYTVTDPLGATATEFIRIAVSEAVTTTTTPPPPTTTLPPG
jgi:hypothetical protein